MRGPLARNDRCRIAARAGRVSEPPCPRIGREGGSTVVAIRIVIVGALATSLIGATATRSDGAACNGVGVADVIAEARAQCCPARNHGAYVSCAAHVSNVAVKEGRTPGSAAARAAKAGTAARPATTSTTAPAPTTTSTTAHTTTTTHAPSTTTSTSAPATTSTHHGTSTTSTTAKASTTTSAT